MERRIVVVTGANRGLGLGVAEALARGGDTVILCARTLQRAEQAAGSIGAGVIPCALEITDDTHLAALGAMLTTRFGRLDVLVNNAAIYPEGNDGASVRDIASEVIAHAFAVNALGPYRLCRAFLPLIMNAPEGRIVNVSSGMGALAGMGAGWPAYRMSKAALNAFTRILAAELAHTCIKVNAVCPGWVRTDMGGPEAPRSIAEGIRGILWAARLPHGGPTGGFFRDSQQIDW